MKTRQLFFYVAILMIGLTSCKKQPEADFTTDKASYIAGETIKLTNKTIDGVTYLWTMPDGQTATSKDVNYTTDVNENDGTLIFKLKAYSKKNKKMDETQQSVSLKAAKGDVIFWQITGSGFGTTTVTVNGLTSVITVDSPSSPDCGTSGNAVFNELKVGIYSFTATDGTYNWSGNLTIEMNVCLKFQLN